MATEPGLAQLLSHRHHLPLQHTATLSSPPRQGFGNVAREYWLGNEAVHRLTSRKAHLLRVELCDWEGHQTSIQYEHFQLGSEKQRYRWAWGPGLWVVRGPKASGCRVCTTGHSLGVSYFHHLAPIWAHVTGSGGGCLALSTYWPLGGVKRLSGTPPCPQQKGSSKVSQPTYRQQEWGLTSQSVPCGKVQKSPHWEEEHVPALLSAALNKTWAQPCQHSLGSSAVLSTRVWSSHQGLLPLPLSGLWYVIRNSSQHFPGACCVLDTV